MPDNNVPPVNHKNSIETPAQSEGVSVVQDGRVVSMDDDHIYADKLFEGDGTTPCLQSLDWFIVDFTATQIPR